MNRQDTTTRTRETTRDQKIIKTLEDLKKRFAKTLVGLDEFDPARLETQKLYDNIVSTLIANEQMTEASSDDLRCNENEVCEEPRDS